jgi:dihydrofolate reductase
MRKVVYGGACSLDGFLTGPAGEMDWLHNSPDVQKIMAATWVAADTILFGRKTWEGAVARGGGGGGMPGVKAYVFSRTLTALPGGGADLVTSDAGAFAHALKQQPGKDIIVMSGGNFARSLLEADAIDEIGFNIHPVLLGSGVPALLDPGRRVRLELSECRVLDGGCVFVMYKVKR